MAIRVPLGDMDIWIARTPENADRVVRTLGEFGFTCTAELLSQANQIVRMGVQPFRIEVLTTIDGVEFTECFAERVQTVLDGVEVSLISLPQLKMNKKASGRFIDINDLENLP